GGPLGGKGKRVRVGADGAVRVVAGHGVERLARAGESPEAAARGLRAREFRDPRGRGGAKGHRDGTPRDAEMRDELSFECGVIDGHGNAPPWVGSVYCTVRCARASSPPRSSP